MSDAAEEERSEMCVQPESEIPRGRRRRRAWALLALASAALVGFAGCGGFRPYRRMAQAATSEESARSQAEDQRLRGALRQALIKVDPALVFHVTPYVYMGHAYLVGFVDTPAKKERTIAAAQAVPGVRSVDAYLPPPPAAGAPATADATEKTAVKAALALSPDEVVTRIEVEVLAGQAVLLGVVDDEEAIDNAVSAARGVDGVTGVTNFLLLPESEYERRRPELR